MKITNVSDKIISIGNIALLPDGSTESVKTLTPAINTLVRLGKLKVEETKTTSAKATAKKATAAKAEEKTTETTETKSE